MLEKEFGTTHKVFHSSFDSPSTCLALTITVFLLVSWGSEMR